MSAPQAGIVSYGVYLPELCISTQLIAEAQGQARAPGLGVKQKTVPELDEDTATISTAAASQALARLGNKREQITEQIGTLFVGSESHPYAVKPTGTMVAQALGLPHELAMADLQFACKAGSQSLQIALTYVQAGQAAYGMAIGADTAQSAPGDALEYTAAAGGAAFVVGSSKVIAKLLGTASYATDTPDFWRRPRQAFPQHGGRFTGEPAYFKHIGGATKALLKRCQLEPSDFQYAVFHTPNGKFPVSVAKRLGFSSEQLKYSLSVEMIGNTYAAASLIALTNVLDNAQPGEKILVTSYGSGAGADSFAFECTPEILSYQQKITDTLTEQIKRLQPITYTQYRQRSEG
jgi:hydroxymethylglutaryl-CoA synthase